MILRQQYHKRDMMQVMNDSALGLDVDECIPVSGEPVPAGVAQRAALLLVRVGALLGEIADDTLAETGIGGRGYSILAILATDGPDSQFELAQMLGKAPGVIVSGIDQLEGAGLVERNRDPTDRRRTRVTLTGAGRAALVRADEIAEKAIADTFAGLDARELDQLKGLLRKGLVTAAAA